MIDDHHAVLFGGVQYYGGEKRINGIYILDLKIMVSTRIMYYCCVILEECKVHNFSFTVCFK